MADLLVGRTPDGAAVTVATDDLVTHGVIVGMTGSGKTGLGVVLVEECLQAGIPVLAIDPKGDLTNLGLVFPQLSAAEFEPWVDAAQAKAAGQTTAEFAAGQAQLWRDGLAGWGIGPAELTSYAGGHEVAVYTPGSTAGIPLNVLGSLAAPDTDDPEIVADEIDGYVTSLLSLVGVDPEPTSREHILLSNIIAAAWSAGEDIDLPTLLARVQQPPMRKLGVFDLDVFFPPTDRTAFAMRLNTVLAAPGFATWISGDPIDIEAMLRTPDGRPRAAVVTTAHLSDEERQSATSLVLSKLITWMRRQTGTTDLRVLLYMDEVAGYLPPVANPPTKKPILLLMKQARAFGVGVVLSTQNPVDLDYKAISNAGTWMIGRLTTEQDKARLLDGMPSGADLSDAIAGLGKRQFVLRQADGVRTFATRWARSYLRGPLTRAQIQQLTGDTAEAPGPAVPEQVPEPAAAADETPVMPPVADGVPVAYLDPAAAWAAAVGAVPAGPVGPRLQAAAVARVVLHYQLARADLDHEEEYEAVLHPLPEGTQVQPLVVDYDDRDLLTEPPPAPRYVLPQAPIASRTYWSGLQKTLVSHVARSEELEVLHNRALRLYSRVDETPEEFTQRCRRAAQDAADAKAAALHSKYASRLRTLQTRLDTATTRAQQATTSGMVDSAASVLGGFLRGRRSMSSITAAARRASAAKARVDAAHTRVAEAQSQIADLEADLAGQLQELQDEWEGKAADVEPLTVIAPRTRVRVSDLRLVWIPVG